MNNKKLTESLKKDKNENVEFSEEKIENFLNDEKHTIEKGNKNQDIRFNPNKNRKEIDIATSENQLF